MLIEAAITFHWYTRTLNDDPGMERVLTVICAFIAPLCDLTVHSGQSDRSRGSTEAHSCVKTLIKNESWDFEQRLRMRGSRSRSVPGKGLRTGRLRPHESVKQRYCAQF